MQNQTIGLSISQHFKEVMNQSLNDISTGPHSCSFASFHGAVAWEEWLPEIMGQLTSHIGRNYNLLAFTACKVQRGPCFPINEDFAEGGHPCVQVQDQHVTRFKTR